jgi:hypothetical protein
MQTSIHMERNVPLMLRDGTTLRADIYRSADAHKHPASALACADDGGRLVGVGLTPGSLNQSAVEKRNDVLCYTTPELKDAVEVTGPLVVHLYAATSARDTDFTAKLAQVYPDGRAYNLAEGLIRASGRTFGEQPQPINPHEVYEYVITLGHTSQLFRKGQRIRLDVSSSNFPQFDRNLNTGSPIGEDARGIPAMQTIYHTAAYPSYVDLPVIPS